MTPPPRPPITRAPTAASKLVAGRAARRRQRTFNDLAFAAREAQRYGLPLRDYLNAVAFTSPDYAARCLRLLARVEKEQA